MLAGPGDAAEDGTHRGAEHGADGRAAAEDGQFVAAVVAEAAAERAEPELHETEGDTANQRALPAPAALDNAPFEQPDPGDLDVLVANPGRATRGPDDGTRENAVARRGVKRQCSDAARDVPATPQRRYQAWSRNRACSSALTFARPESAGCTPSDT